MADIGTSNCERPQHYGDGHEHFNIIDVLYEIKSLVVNQRTMPCQKFVDTLMRK